MPDDTENTTPDTDSDAEPLGDAGKKALEAEREARKTVERQFKEAAKAREALEAKVREFEDRDKSETEKLTGRIKELEQLYEQSQKSLSAKDVDILRRDVARDKNVPVSAVTGATKEEMEAAADALLEWRGSQPKKPTGFQSGASAPNSASEKDKAAAAIRAMRRGV